MKETIIVIFVTVLLIGLIMVAIGVGIYRTETVECRKWQEYAAKYPRFYITEWQSKQCQHHNVPVDAVVVTP